MLYQLKILDKDEQLECVLANNLENACPIIEFRTPQQMRDDGTYTDTCILTIPASHTDAQYVIEGNYILFQDEDGFWQEYRITDKTNTDSAVESTIAATGEHAFYELLGEPLEDIRPETTAAAAVIQALSGTRWSIGTADDLGTSSCRIYKTNVLEGLATIAAAWGGELRFRLEVVGGVIAARKVDIVSSIGNDTGKRFEFKKDLVQIIRKVNTQSLATKLIGRGKGVQVEGGTEQEDPAYGRRLEFDEVEWTTGGGDPVDKPLGQNWIQDDTAAAAYGPGGRHICDYVIFDNCTDAEELLTLTYNELQIRKVPLTTYQMSVIRLEEITGYEHESVRLGDTVDVIDNVSGYTGTARIIYIDPNRINPADCSVTIGNYVPTLTQSGLSTEKTVRSLYDRSGVYDRANFFETSPDGMSALVDLLKVQLASTSSYFHTDVNGNFIFENAATFDDSTAALKLGAGIFALANTKTAGEWDWRTFGTGDGFTADEISAGTLRAAIVFAGTLQAVSGTFTTLTAGIAGAQRVYIGTDANSDPFIKFYDNTDTLNVTWTKRGFLFKDTTELRNYTIGSRSGIGIFGA